MERKEKVEVERLRRITGYLTSDIRFWNDGKKAELKDRVKHIQIGGNDDENS